MIILEELQFFGSIKKVISLLSSGCPNFCETRSKRSVEVSHTVTDSLAVPITGLDRHSHELKLITKLLWNAAKTKMLIFRLLPACTLTTYNHSKIDIYAAESLHL